MSRGRRSSSWSSTSRLGPPKRCAILIRGSLVCAWCRRDQAPPLQRPGHPPPYVFPGRYLEIDHVLARAQQGGVQPWNLVGACSGCNLARDLDALEERLWGLGLSLRGAEAEVRRQTALRLDVRAGKDLARIWYPWLDAYREEQLRAWHRRAALRRAEREVAVLEGLGDDAFPFGELAPPEAMAAE